MIRVIAGMLLFLPLSASAAAVFTNPCPIPGLPCVQGIGGLRDFLGTQIFPAMRIAFVGIAVFMLFGYAFRLLMESEDENTITEVKNAYIQAVAGAAIVGLASMFVDTFGRGAAATIINPAPFQAGLGNVITYIRLMVSISVTALIAFQGVRLILLQGQESEIEQQKKKFLHSLVGVAVILLATPIVNAIQPGSNAGILALEIVGIINFLLELLGALALVAMIAAGAMLIISTDEGLKDRAKKTIFATIITLVVVLVSYSVVKYCMDL